MTDPSEIAGELLRHGAATLGESGARRMHSRIRAAWPGALVAGPALPVRCTPGDNLALHVAVTRADPAVVLVADMGGAHELGYWGEVLTTAAQVRGIAGLVIDGGVRDVDALAAHGFPVFSSGIALTGATKSRPGTVGHAVVVGDVSVETGDWIVGDRDGVAVVPHATRADVIAAARTRTAREAALFEQLRSGRTTIELLDLDPSIIDHP